MKLCDLLPLVSGVNAVTVFDETTDIPGVSIMPEFNPMFDPMEFAFLFLYGNAKIRRVSPLSDNEIGVYVSRYPGKLEKAVAKAFYINLFACVDYSNEKVAGYILDSLKNYAADYPILTAESLIEFLDNVF